MLDATIWKRDGEGQKVVLNGGPDGPVIEVIRMTFYRHHVTNQLKIIHERVSR